MKRSPKKKPSDDMRNSDLIRKSDVEENAKKKL